MVVLVTATPIELAIPVARALGMDKAHGTCAQVDEYGRYTGELETVTLHGAEKGALVQRLAEEQGLSLAASHAYGDSLNDVSMLEAVGYAHAVNPDAGLRRLALERGWAVHELRTARQSALVGVGPVLSAAGLLGAGFAGGLLAGRRSRR